MVRIVNIFKAAGLWVGTIFLLYGNQEVSSRAALSYTGYGALAPTRSPESQPTEFRELTREGTAEFERGTHAPSPGYQTMASMRDRTREVSTGGTLN